MSGSDKEVRERQMESQLEHMRVRLSFSLKKILLIDPPPLSQQFDSDFGEEEEEEEERERERERERANEQSGFGMGNGMVRI